MTRVVHLFVCPAKSLPLPTPFPNIISQPLVASPIIPNATIRLPVPVPCQRESSPKTHQRHPSGNAHNLSASLLLLTTQSFRAVLCCCCCAATSTLQLRMKPQAATP